MFGSSHESHFFVFYAHYYNIRTQISQGKEKTINHGAGERNRTVVSSLPLVSLGIPRVKVMEREMGIGPT